MTFNPNPTPTVNTTITTSLGIFNFYSIPPYSPPDARFDYLTPSYPYRLVEGETNGQMANLPGNYSYPYVSSYILRTKKWAIKRRATQISSGIVTSITELETNLWQTATIDGSEPQPTNLAILPPNFQNSEYAFDYFIGEAYEIPETISEVPITVECFAISQTSSSYSLVNLPKPQIADYFNGYFLDPIEYKIDINLPIVVPTSGTILIHYYFKEDEVQTDSDGVNHRTISIQTTKLEIKKNLSVRLKFTAIPCSISLEGELSICTQVRAQIEAAYPNAFSEYLPVQQNIWESLYQQQLNTLQSQQYYYQSIALDNKPYLWAATERWGQVPIADRNTGLGIGENVLDSFVFDKYFKLNSDGSYGTDMADSARIKNIHAALGGDKFGTYIEPTTGERVERISNLGWYLENIARILGLRVDEKGYIDSSKEEDLYTRSILDNPQYDKNAYSKNSFGRYGRLTPHLTNSNGDKAFDKVADIPQLLEALFEHLNRSIGIQQGTEIEILNSTTGKKDYYPNQFAMLLDIHAKITEIQLNAKENHNLLFVLAHELRELFSGIGIPVVFKSLYNRYGKLLYLGHQSDKGSLLTSITTLKMNVGMLVGNLLVDRPRDSRNPLERIFSKPKKKG